MPKWFKIKNKKDIIFVFANLVYTSTETFPPFKIRVLI